MFTYVIDQYFDETDNPRDWDNLGLMATWHRRYTLGDNQPSTAPDEWLSDLLKEHPSAIILPLYLYDHGGITISTAPFSCPWDSGQVGYIYTTPERVREMGIGGEWKRLTKARREAIKEMLSAEVKTYDQYIRGDVYSFIIKDEDGEIIEAGHGYYDRDECEQEAQENLKYYQDQDRKKA